MDSYPQYAKYYTDVMGDIKMMVDSPYAEGNYNHIGEIEPLKNKQTPIIQGESSTSQFCNSMDCRKYKYHVL